MSAVIAAACAAGAVLALAHRPARPARLQRSSTAHPAPDLATLVGLLGNRGRRALGVRVRAPRGADLARIERDLPDLIDLLALAVGAGLSVPAALPAVAAVAPASLRADLQAAVDAVAGGRPSDEAVAGLASCWGDPGRPLAHALADHLRYGTAVLPALERTAAEARARRRRAAETRARKLPVLLLFPLVLCTLPAFGLPNVGTTRKSARRCHHPVSMMPLMAPADQPHGPESENERLSRVMVRAQRFSPWGRPERAEGPPSEGGPVPDRGSGPLPDGGSGQVRVG